MTTDTQELVNRNQIQDTEGSKKEDLIKKLAKQE